MVACRTCLALKMKTKIQLADFFLCKCFCSFILLRSPWSHVHTPCANSC